MDDSSIRIRKERKSLAQKITLTYLPPCKVCGSAASGLHYGAITCEACKTFFKRSLDNCSTYKCRSKHKQGTCTFTKDRKCTFCRLQKCNNIGMSRKAVKIGRYTNEQRTLNIIQMKERKEATGWHGCRSSPPTSLISSDVHRSLECSKMAIYSQKQEITGYNSSDGIIIDSTSDIINEQSHLAKAIVQANEKHNSMFRILKDEKDIAERQLRYYNNCLLKDKLFGPRNAPSWEEFDMFYQITGMAMDNRVEEVSLTMQWLDVLAKTAIRFAKAIPGFKDLNLNDQAALIKGGYFEFWNICTYRGMNPELMVAVFVHGSTFSANEMSWPGKRVYMQRLMKFSKRLHNLQITKDEDALMQAIVLTSPDRGELEQSGPVEKLHWDIVVALWNLLHQNHEHPRRTFSKIIDCLVQFREFTEYDREFVQNLPFDIPEIHSSELLCELSNCHCQISIREPSW